MPYLNVPLLAQWGATANAYQKDCGAAAVAMCLAYYAKLEHLTVDDLAAETALKYGAGGLDCPDLVALAGRHGLATSVHQAVTEDGIRAQIGAGHPVIILVAYRYVTGRLDQNDRVPGQDGHFLVVVGYDDTHFVVNDPDYWWPHTEQGHDYLLPVTELAPAMAAYQNAAVFMEEDRMPNAQIIDLANQILAIAQAMPDPAPPPPSMVVTVKTNANVRSQPFVSQPGDANRIGSFAAGKTITVTKTSTHGSDGRDWYQVLDTNLAGGWIAAETLALPNP